MDIDPAKLVFLYSSGTANMGSTTDNTNHLARFWLDGGNSRFVVSGFEAHFGSTGSGTAELSVKRDSGYGRAWDTELYVESTAGIDNDVFVRIPEEEMKNWVFDRVAATDVYGDQLVFEWTNPDSGNISWAIRVEVLRVAMGRNMGMATAMAMGT